MKRLFYVLGFFNVGLLGVSGYFLLIAPGTSQRVSSIGPKPQPSLGISKHPASLDVGPEESVPGRSTAGVVAHPLLATGITSISSAPGQPSLSQAKIAHSSSVPDNEQSAGAVAQRSAPPQPAGRHSSPQAGAPVASYNPFLAPVSASPSTNEAPPSASIPFAFTVSPDGATPVQADKLHQLQSRFVSDVGSQNQSPSDPAYAKTWQAAQSSSDATFAQQFGWQAFVQQQIAQVQAGAK